MATFTYFRSVLIIIVNVLGLLCVTEAANELVFAHAPSYVTFQEQTQNLETSQVPNLVANTLGIRTDTDLAWKGLVQGSLFKKPKANVLFTIITHSKHPLAIKNLAKFPVNDDVPLPDIEALMNLIQGSFMETPLMLDLQADNQMFDLKTEENLFKNLPNSIRKISNRLLDSDSILSKLTSGSLNMTVNSDLALMSEMQIIDDVMKTLMENPTIVKNKTPDFFSFTISGLKAVTDKHGPGSQKAIDATKMVTDFVHHVTDNFRKVYKDNVVVEVLSASPQKGHIRKVRSLLADPTPTPKPAHNLNLASDYDKDFPAIFNIVLWLMILLVLVIYAIAYGMWFMDPGLDSIIYRMTSQRLKKD